MKELEKFIDDNLFNAKGRFEGQRLKRRWFELRKFEHIWDEYRHILTDRDAMFQILLRLGRVKPNSTKTKFPHIHESKCIVCSGKTELANIGTGYYAHCSDKCADITRSRTKALHDSSKRRKIQERRKATSKKLYGDENYNNREQAVKTCLERHGVENTSMLEETSIKRAQTCLERYGDKNYNNREQAVKTCLERYNTEYVSQIEDVKLKMRQTKLEKYGDEYYRNPEKSIETCIRVYGVPYSFQSENNLSKSRATFMENYGCWVSQAEETKIKTRITREKSGCWMPLSELSDFKMYHRAVWKFTRAVMKELPNFDKRGQSIDSYHCDHRYSIFQGFKDNVPPYIIGHISNLEMINSRENLSKKTKCSITLNELFDKIGV